MTTTRRSFLRTALLAPFIAPSITKALTAPPKDRITFANGSTFSWDRGENDIRGWDWNDPAQCRLWESCCRIPGFNGFTFDKARL